jgi:coenzyme PQQ precursor peptide PqqA
MTAICRCAVDHDRREVTAMVWEAPDFVEVKMDAEINSYQDDFGQEPDDRF